MNPNPSHEADPPVPAPQGLPPSFARDTVRLVLTGKPGIDIGTRCFEIVILALLSTVYSLALVLVVLVFDGGRFRELLALPLPRWGVLVLACLGFTTVLRGLWRLRRAT